MAGEMRLGVVEYGCPIEDCDWLTAENVTFRVAAVRTEPATGGGLADFALSLELVGGDLQVAEERVRDHLEGHDVTDLARMIVRLADGGGSE